MAEMDRDKAAEEALKDGVCACNVPVLNLLWRRAQEAEREESDKLLAEVRVALSGLQVEVDIHRRYCQNDMTHDHSQFRRLRSLMENLQNAHDAAAIRNRSLARAPEEAKLEPGKLNPCDKDDCAECDENK